MIMIPIAIWVRQACAVRIECEMLDSTGKELVGIRNATQNNKDNSTSFDPVGLLFWRMLVRMTPTPNAGEQQPRGPPRVVVLDVGLLNGLFLVVPMFIMRTTSSTTGQTNPNSMYGFSTISSCM